MTGARNIESGDPDLFTLVRAHPMSSLNVGSCCASNARASGHALQSAANKECRTAAYSLNNK